MRCGCGRGTRLHCYGRRWQRVLPSVAQVGQLARAQPRRGGRIVGAGDHEEDGDARSHRGGRRSSGGRGDVPNRAGSPLPFDAQIPQKTLACGGGAALFAVMNATSSAHVTDKNIPKFNSFLNPSIWSATVFAQRLVVAGCRCVNGSTKGRRQERLVEHVADTVGEDFARQRRSHRRAPIPKGNQLWSPRESSGDGVPFGCMKCG